MVHKLSYTDRAAAEADLLAKGVLQETKDENDNPQLTYAPKTHAVVWLGNIVLERAELDSEGEVIKEAVLSPSYHVDVMTDAVLDFGDAEVVIASGQVPYHAFA